MADEIQDLKARRAEIENAVAKESRKGGFTKVLAGSAVGGALVLGGAWAYDLAKPEPVIEAPIATSNATEFPDDRNAGLKLELPEAPTPISIDRPVIQTVTDSATLERLATVEAELEAAQKAALAASKNATDAENQLRVELDIQREKFQEELAALSETAAKDLEQAQTVQRALQSQLADADRELAIARNDWNAQKASLEMSANDGLRQARSALADVEARYQAQVADLTNQLNSINQDSEAEQARRDAEHQSEIATLTERFELQRQRDLLEFQRQLLELQNVDPAEAQRLNLEAEQLALEAADRQRLEALRAERQAEEDARINSGMVAVSNNAVAEAGAGGPRTLSGNELFVRRGISPVPVSQAETIANPQATILQGTIIQASLETAVDSSLPGQLRAVVSDHVYSMDGSAILIPAGSKVFGEYSDNMVTGQRRILIAWTRIMTPNNRSISIASFGADSLGRSGTGGTVDTRFGARFGSAALISIIGATPAVVAQSATDNPLSQDAVENIGDNFSAATANALNNVLSIKPIIYVKQGSAISIILDRDVEIF